MPTYTTKYVKNLCTGESFTFEVPDEKLERLKYQKELVKSRRAPMLGSEEELTKTYEFSFFPSYQELLKIGFNNGFTLELIIQILTDFGLTEPYIQRLIEDNEFISNTKPWFKGIIGDGERASRTIRVVYDVTKSYFSLTGKSGWEWVTEMSP